MTLEFSETNSGKILLSYEGYKYTYKHPLNKTGFAYKCFKPSCTAFLHLNKAKDTVTSQGGTHNHGRISSVSSVNTPPCTPPPTSQVPGNIQLISGGHRDPPVSTKSAGYQTDPSPLVSIESSCFIDRLADKERELMQARDKINSLQTTVELLGNANAAHSKMFADMEKNVMKKLDTRSSNSSTSSKPKILYSVYGDSHVRYIPNVISKQCDSLVSCNHYTKSGGVFSDISAILRHVDTPRKNDWAIVMCGCNDIQNYKWNQVKDSLDKIIDKFKTCKLCLVSIPYRYDKAHLNSKIRDVNKVIMDYVKSKNEKVRFLESTEVVIYDDYALDLLHLGPMGTDKICQKLIEIMTKPVESTSKSRTTSTHVPMKTKSNRRQVGHHTKVPEKRADAGAGQNTAPVPEKPKKKTRRRKPKHTPRNEQRREFMDSRRRDGGGGQRSTPATRPQLVFNTGSNLGTDEPQSDDISDVSDSVSIRVYHDILTPKSQHFTKRRRIGHRVSRRASQGGGSRTCRPASDSNVGTSGRVNLFRSGGSVSGGSSAAVCGGGSVSGGSSAAVCGGGSVNGGSSAAVCGGGSVGGGSSAAVCGGGSVSGGSSAVVCGGGSVGGGSSAAVCGGGSVSGGSSAVVCGGGSVGGGSSAAVCGGGSVKGWSSAAVCGGGSVSGGSSAAVCGGGSVKGWSSAAVCGGGSVGGGSSAAVCGGGSVSGGSSAAVCGGGSVGGGSPAAVCGGGSVGGGSSAVVCGGGFVNSDGVVIAGVAGSGSSLIKDSNSATPSNTSPPRKTFRCVHFNAQSLHPHLHEIQAAINTIDVHAILISESWLKPSISDNIVQIPGFVLSRNDRPGNKRGGGVAMYVRQDLVHKVVMKSTHSTVTVEESSVELLAVEITVLSVKILVAVVYKPPNVYNMEELENLFISCVPMYEHIVVMGDFNINMLNESSSQTLLLKLYPLLT
ncbi:hypothetical protein M8J77_018706 [Diaphorina citri]|nr:hypothetical protein M8J77_018706 [Diaphorina citri]